MAISLVSIGGVPANRIGECMVIIGHRMSMLSEDCTDNIILSIYLNLEGLFQVW